MSHDPVYDFLVHQDVVPEEERQVELLKILSRPGGLLDKVYHMTRLSDNVVWPDGVPPIASVSEELWLWSFTTTSICAEFVSDYALEVVSLLLKPGFLSSGAFQKNASCIDGNATTIERWRNNFMTVRNKARAHSKKVSNAFGTDGNCEQVENHDEKGPVDNDEKQVDLFTLINDCNTQKKAHVIGGILCFPLLDWDHFPAPELRKRIEEKISKGQEWVQKEHENAGQGWRTVIQERQEALSKQEKKRQKKEKERQEEQREDNEQKKQSEKDEEEILQEIGPTQEQNTRDIRVFQLKYLFSPLHTNVLCACYGLEVTPANQNSMQKSRSAYYDSFDKGTFLDLEKVKTQIEDGEVFAKLTDIFHKTKDFKSSLIKGTFHQKSDEDQSDTNTSEGSDSL